MNSPLQIDIPTIEEQTADCKALLQQELLQGVVDADGGAISARDLSLARGNITALSFVLGAGFHGVYRFLRDFIARQAIPTKASGEFLDEWLKAYGIDRKPAETESEARYRLQQRLQNPPMGGAPADYVNWALAVTGVARAWAVRNWAGACSVGVIVADVDPATGGLIAPSNATLQAVYDYITDPLRGPPDELFVLPPLLQTTDFVIGLRPDTAAIREGVVAELQNLFYRQAAPGMAIPMSQITETISAVAGEYNHRIFSPAIASGGLLQPTTAQHVLALGSIDFVTLP